MVFCHNPIEAIKVAKLFTHVLSQKNLSNLNIQSDFFGDFEWLAESTFKLDPFKINPFGNESL